MVDTISSVLVLWRFWGGGKTVSEEVLATREKRASVAIALTFILLAVTVTSVAAAHLAEEQSPKDVEVRSPGSLTPPNTHIHSKAQPLAHLLL